MTELLSRPAVSGFIHMESPAGTIAERAIEEAYDTYRASLVRRITSLTRDPAVAEDIAQESFLRLATAIRNGRAPDSVSAWLYRVALNLVASRGRHATVVERRQADLVDRRLQPSPETAAIEAEEHRMLREALGTLGPTDREAVLLAAHGYGGPEIAARLGRTQGATRTLLCRARSRLRSRLEAAGMTA
jgi:RNA polymerase sigma-70 factor (ECF subfamily)